MVLLFFFLSIPSLLFTVVTILFDWILFSMTRQPRCQRLIFYFAALEFRHIYIYGALSRHWLEHGRISAACRMSTSSLVFRLKVAELFLTPLGTMYFIFPPICKSNCCAVDYFARGFCHIPPALQLWKLPQIPTFILADFSHHLSKIVIIRFLCFCAVEKQTGLWTDHYINSFLKGGSYFKKGWRNAKRDLNFNLNLFQQVKGSFERGFQQRWWYLKVINKHLNLQWKTVILLLSSVGEELGSLWSHPKKKD